MHDDDESTAHGSRQDLMTAAGVGGASVAPSSAMGRAPTIVIWNFWPAADCLVDVHDEEDATEKGDDLGAGASSVLGAGLSVTAAVAGRTATPILGACARTSAKVGWEYACRSEWTP